MTFRKFLTRMKIPFTVFIFRMLHKVYSILCVYTCMSVMCAMREREIEGEMEGEREKERDRGREGEREREREIMKETVGLDVSMLVVLLCH